jgi:hypothetical protein
MNDMSSLVFNRQEHKIADKIASGNQGLSCYKVLTHNLLNCGAVPSRWNNFSVTSRQHAENRQIALEFIFIIGFHHLNFGVLLDGYIDRNLPVRELSSVFKVLDVLQIWPHVSLST